MQNSVSEDNIFWDTISYDTNNTVFKSACFICNVLYSTENSSNDQIEFVRPCERHAGGS
jgi:hypothetical protein